MADGAVALYNNTTGIENTASGWWTLYGNTTGSFNTAFGVFALPGITTGSWNVGIGDSAGEHINTGSYNILLGSFAGQALTGNDSNNILIGHVGVPGDSGVIRIGSTPQGPNGLTQIAGIYGVTPPTGAGGTLPVVINSGGQLGTSASLVGPPGPPGPQGPSGPQGPQGVPGPPLALPFSASVSSSSPGFSLTNTNGNGIGIFGQSFNGVQGFNSMANGVGVAGVTSLDNGPGENGVLGVMQGNLEAGAAVEGEINPGGFGLLGVVGALGYYDGNGQEVGVIANTENCPELGIPNCWAGKFFGTVQVNGLFEALQKEFKIDHPLDPGNKYLVHSTVESNEMVNIYKGHITTDDHGDAVVTLPQYFQALNTNIEYHLTVIGQFAQVMVSQEVQNNQFSIKTDKPNVKVSWQVLGVRQDAYAKAHPMQVEQEKPASERGKYLAPTELGMPVEKGIGYEQAQRLKSNARVVLPHK